MRWLIQIHESPATRAMFAAMSDEERRAAFQVYWDVERDATGAGELVDSKALDTGAQRGVRRGPDGPVAVDAPRPDAAEVLSGYFLVDVADEARAIAIAARFPEAGVDGGVRVARVWTEEDFAALEQ